MKAKYIFIIVGAMVLLFGLMYFISLARNDWNKSFSIITSVIGLGTLLTGIFWKKQ